MAATNGSAKVVPSRYKHVKSAAKLAHKVAHKHVAAVKPAATDNAATSMFVTSATAATSVSVTSATAATSMTVNPQFKVPAKV